MVKATDLPPIPDCSIAHPSPPAPTWKYPMPTQSSINLRDHFAGMAMQALVTGYTSNQRGFNPREFAILAYGMADEMIKERSIK